MIREAKINYENNFKFSISKVPRAPLFLIAKTYLAKLLNVTTWVKVKTA